MLDKSKELNASIKLVNDKLHFEAVVDSNVPISIDYFPPIGDGLGYSSLELLLISLSTCMGSSVLTLLRKMQKNIIALDINSKGIRREEHPTGFKNIYIEMNLKSADIKPEDLDKVIKLSDSYCPVYAMLKGNVEIDVKYNIYQ